MIRKIITIDSERCNGCGLCAAACHEGAIGMVNGKAVLLREDYCDGLGDCLPACPTEAITMTEREAPAYDEAAVAAHLAASKPAGGCAGGGCPGSRSQTFAAPAAEVLPAETCLGQWPVQLRLVSPMAGFFDGADLLLAADCSAFARGDFHARYMKGKVTVIGCPKLDPVDYSEKLTEIFRLHNIRSVTLVRMEVPCCGGLERAVQKALAACGRPIPFESVTLSVRGEIL